MKLALFFNGQKLIAGTDNGQSSFFDSSLIFQDPDLFTARFLFQIRVRFGIDDLEQIENLVLAISGVMDNKNNRIKRSYFLNDIAITKIYDGFSFNDALLGNVDRDRIFLLNDALALTLGASQRIEQSLLPAMVLSLDDGIGVGFINSPKSVDAREWGGDYVPSISKNMWEALGRNSIYSLLFDKKININETYTEYLIQSIKYLSHKYAKDNPPIKSVFIMGEKTQYLSERQLREKLNEYDLSIVTDENERRSIIISGCFAYPLYVASQNNRVTKIQYFSGQELIYDFDDFQKYREHFISMKPLSNPENYYKIFYASGSVTTIAMRDINDVSELDLYRF